MQYAPQCFVCAREFLPGDVPKCDFCGRRVCTNTDCREEHRRGCPGELPSPRTSEPRSRPKKEDC